MNVVDGVAVRAVKAVVPSKVVATDDYEHLTPEERNRFQNTTGISQRHIVAEGQLASDLCQVAAESVLEYLQWEKSTLGALVLVTQTADQPVPATSIVLQQKLGLSSSCLAFDVNLGCSAYPYGMAIVSSLMKTLGIGRTLLLVGDVSSRVCAYHDKSAWPLFGDAGSATALELDAKAAPMCFDLKSDGAGKNAIIIPGGGLASRLPPTLTNLEEEVGADQVKRRSDQLILKGADIFGFAISKVPSSIRSVMEQADKTVSDIDFLVLHQANKMINDRIAKKVGFAPEQSLSSLEDYGNTSSASIPVTLSVHANRFEQQKQLVLCGFGVGLSWSSMTLQLDGGVVLPCTETDYHD